MNSVKQFQGIYKHFAVRLVHGHPRLFIAFLFGLSIDIFLPESIASQLVSRHIISLNAGAILYIFLAMKMMFFSKVKKVHDISDFQDEGQTIILFLALGAVLTSLVSIVAELSAAKELHGLIRYEHIGLAALTILTSWCFIHLTFALHYAHEYYINLSRKMDAGLQFPGNDLPDYADFLYFSSVIGTSGQTADVSFSTSKMRKTGAVHCVFSFFFNTTILALTINIASGLF
jgi:uncharacterized membrane protein